PRAPAHSPLRGDGGRRGRPLSRRDSRVRRALAGHRRRESRAPAEGAPRPRRCRARAVHLDAERARDDAQGRAPGGGPGTTRVTGMAIVTGAGQGLGAAIADALEAAGADVARTDVAGAEVASTRGEPTILVNNAGINRIGPSESLE